jgi:undecaprenyl-diphosphatase
MATPRHQVSGLLDPDPHATGAGPAAGGGRRKPVAAALPFLLGWLVVVLGALVGAGMLLTEFATGNDLGEADGAVARWFVEQRTSTLNDVTFWASNAADTLVVIGLAAIAVVVMRLAFKRWRESLLVVAALVGEVVLFLATTLLVDRERPDVTHLDKAPPTSSFPSGHTAAAVCLYGTLALILWSRMRPGALRGLVVTLLWLLPVVVGTSRLYRGMHHLTDVLAGLLFGIAWLAVAVAGMRRGVRHGAGAHPLPSADGYEPAGAVPAGARRAGEGRP